MIKIFLHIATMGEYQKIFDELINKIEDSELIYNCELNVCIVGDGNLEEFTKEGYRSDIKFNNIKYHKVGSINEYEFPTLQFIEDNIQDGDKVLYLNGLGVTNDSIYKQSWRKYLSYFNITKWEECVKALDNGYNTCGVDFRTDPVPHYSGNFWWANASYLRTLPKIQILNKENSPRVLTLRHNAEMYIGMNPNVKPRVLHQSNISQYSRHLFTYDEENYIDKISEQDIIIAKGEIE